MAKVGVYFKMLVNQFISNIFDLDIETNDIINEQLKQLRFLETKRDDWLSFKQMVKYAPELNMLDSFTFIMDARLVEISDKWQEGHLSYLTSSQVKQIIEARFAESQLRQTILKTI